MSAIATEAIQRISLAHDAALVEALHAAEPAARVAVLPVVSSRRAAPDVRGLLDDDDPEVRARACDALARIGDTSAVPALFAMLGDASPRAAHAAAAAIQSLGTTDTCALAIDALRTGAPGVRRQALRIIGYLGCDHAYDAVRAAVDDADRRLVELAIAALGLLDDPRVEPALGELSQHVDEVRRAAVMRATVQRGGLQTADVLQRGLSDDAAWVRYYACQGLGRLGDVRATSPLIARLADAAPHVRIAAIEALAQLDTPAAWQALCSAVRSPDPDQQRAALVGIGLRSTAAALPFLLEAARSPDPANRLIAISGLARRAEPQALAALGAAVLDASPDACEAALSLLAEHADRAAADALVAAALATEPSHPVHLVLSRPGATRVAAIRSRLASANERDASVLIAALARMRDEAASALLFECLDLANPAIRRIAATTLIAIDAADARARVARLATDDPDPDVRRACIAAAG
jgi:HEAT repeat protein